MVGLRHSRIAVLSNYPTLSSLVPIVEAVCSDDDTDDEIPQSIQQSYSKKAPKRCVVRSVPWRHNKISEMMDMIDDLRDLLAKSTPKGPSGAPPWIRRRVTPAIESQLKPPRNISKACFNREWLGSQTQQKVTTLKLRSRPNVKLSFKELECILSEFDKSAT